MTTLFKGFLISVWLCDS